MYVLLVLYANGQMSDNFEGRFLGLLVDYFIS